MAKIREKMLALGEYVRGPDVRERAAKARAVGNPRLIDLPAVESAIQEVVRPWLAVVRIGGHPIRARVYRPQPLTP